MGMYTRFTVKGRLRPECVPAVEMFLGPWPGGEWLRVLVEHSFLAAAPGFIEFARKYRADSVGSNGKIEDGVWSFDSNLKNYDGEIDAFIADVMPVLFESVEECEKLYEEFDMPAIYEMRDGRMVEVRPMGMNRDDDSGWW